MCMWADLDDTRGALTDEAALFATLPELTEETVRKVELDFNPFIWYRTIGSRREYTCTSCREVWHSGGRTRSAQQLELDWTSHNGIVRCPHCGYEAVVKCVGKIRNAAYYNEAHGVAVLDAATGSGGGAVWIRTYYIERKYGNWQTRVHAMPRDRWDEVSRCYLAPGVARYWEKGWYADKLEERREVGDKYRSTAWFDAPMGDDGRRTICQGKIEDTFLRYSAWEKARELGLSPQKYMAAYATHPSMEMFVKLGHADVVKRLVRDRVENVRLVDWTASDPASAFRMSRAEYAEFRRRGGSLDLAREYKRYKKKDKRPWEIAELASHFAYILRDNEKKEMLRELGVREDEALRYADRNREGRGVSQTLFTWCDYIRMSREVGRDLTERKRILPADLRAAHDEVMHIRNMIAEEKRRQEVQKRDAGVLAVAEKLRRKYMASDGRYMIRVPESAAEIVGEGAALGHCVGSYNYIQNHAAGKNCILFLRRCEAPEVPWYTIEMSPGRIVQCEGARRDDGKPGYHGHLYRPDLPPDAAAFLDAWEARVTAKKNTKTENKEENVA